MEYTVENKKVVVIRAQESVVTRGITKKLKEFDCDIVAVAEDVKEVNDEVKEAALVVFYLGRDYEDHSSDRVNLKNMLETLSKNGVKVILIGEDLQLEELKKISFVVSSFIWLQRPVDMVRLEKEVSRVLEPPEDIPFESRRVLMIDDDAMYGKVVCEWMKDEFDMSYVSSGVQAITFLSKNAVDLILLDYEMPVNDGPQVLEMLRSQPETAEIPVIFLTSVNSKEQVSRVLSLKPVGYVLKNIARADLIQYLKGVFEKLEDVEK